MVSGLILLIDIWNFKNWIWLSWIGSGLSIAKVKLLKDGGYSAPETMKLVKLGFSVEDILQWQSKGYTKDEADKWLTAGIGCGEAQHWLSAEINADQAKIFKRGGFTTDEAKTWKNAGYEATEASRWKRDGFDLDKIAKLSWEDKFIYSFNFKGLYLGMDEMEAVKKLDKIARQNRCRRYGGVIYNRNRIALVSVMAKNGKVNYISHHPIFTDIKFNDYAMDREGAKSYLEKTYGIKLNSDGSYSGKRVTVEIEQFMLRFKLI